MTFDPRAAIFAEVRTAKRDVFDDPGKVLELDNLLDALGVPRAETTAKSAVVRRINPAGLAIIKQSEGCKLTAYVCPAGKLTIGYGSTGPHVTAGLTLSQERCDALLVEDLDRFEMGVAKIAPATTDNQFAALVSFAFNEGLGNLESSTLLKLHNAGDYAGAQAQFARWNKAKVRGVLTVLPGLTKRRATEAELYGRAA